VTKRKLLGVPFPVILVLSVILLALIIIGFLAGPVGLPLINGVLAVFKASPITLPDWIYTVATPRPAPELPASVIFHLFGLPITNTILAGWFTVIFLVVISWVITRRMQLVPGRLQTIFEFILGWIYDLCKSIAGEKNGRKFFPVVCTIFLFVLFNALLSLIPGFGSIHITNAEGSAVELFRGANTDINTPLALAFISFVFVEFYGLKSLGFGYLQKFLNFRLFFRSIGQVFRGRIKAGLIGLFTGVIDIFIGFLEAMSEFIRLISFTFRLFGNMTAGEILIVVIAFLIPLGVNWLVYGLELLIGFIQALVFAGLTLAFVTMAVASHEEEPHGKTASE
jgi:F-type H+-transporting ATPase subunit a